MQNVALHWISGAFQTTPIPWMELVTGIAPVEQRANYTIKNALQRGSKLDNGYILNHIAHVNYLHPASHTTRSYWWPVSNNIELIRHSIKDVPTLNLTDPITCIGCRLLDCSTRIRINIPAAPPRASKVFEQWYKAWFQQCYKESTRGISIGTDGSYKIKGQGTSAFVVMNGNDVIHTHWQLVVVHSSSDAEMLAVHSAIEYISASLAGCIIVFVDNQAMIKSILQVKSHSLFELSHQNSHNLQRWLESSNNNHIEFRWIPSHLGFCINELADAAVNNPPIGPSPALLLMLASRLHQNKAQVITEWQSKWSAFALTKSLTLKLKKKTLLPNAWNNKGKRFMTLAGDMVTFSRFTWLISGHAPTGEYRRQFFPHKPRGCTCFMHKQTHTHLLMECPKYFSKFSSIIAFNKADNNTTAIFKYLQKNPSTFTFEDKPIDLFKPPWLSSFLFLLYWICFLFFNKTKQHKELGLKCWVRLQIFQVAGLQEQRFDISGLGTGEDRDLRWNKETWITTWNVCKLTCFRPRNLVWSIGSAYKYSKLQDCRNRDSA